MSASPLRLDFSQRIARDSGASGPSNVTRSDSLRFDDGAVIGSCRSRCARGVWDRPSPYRRYFRGVFEALPRRRRCKASAPVLRARSRSRREGHAAGRGRARRVQAGLAAFDRDQITTGRASASGCTPGDEGLPREQGRWLRQPQRLETAVPWTIAEKDPSRLAAPGLGRSMWLSHDVPSSWMASVAWPLETSLRRPIKRSCNFDVAFH